MTTTKSAVTHVCLWPGCTRRVLVKHWGCVAHWAMLPHNLRDLIWTHYEPGQGLAEGAFCEPSEAYLEAMQTVRDWIRAHYPGGGP